MLSVLILTKNEERHIERAIRSVASVASEVVILDSGSTDATVDIAVRLGARVMHHEFVNYAQQFQWGLDNACLAGDWIMRLDADEFLSAAGALEIRDAIRNLPAEVSGLSLKRRHVFMGRWIRYGGRYPLVLLRIWRKGFGRIENRWMDEHIVLNSGRCVTLSQPFTDENLHGIGFFIEKHNSYATREAVDVLLTRMQSTEVENGVKFGVGSTQARWVRFLKTSVYNRLPFWFSAPSYFLLRMTIQGGFLDGREGMIYHFLQAYWYRFLVGTKIVEFEKAINHTTSSREKFDLLSKLTGLRLES